MSLRDLRPLLAVIAVAIAVALAQTLGGLDAGALSLVPPVLLFLPLLAGRYLGESRIARLARRARPARRPRPADVRLPRRRPRAVSLTGLLLASRRAGRAPPAAACA